VNNNQAQSTGFWTTLSKAQKLVAFILGLVTLAGLLISITTALSSYKIDARGTCAPVYLPYDFYEGAPDPIEDRLRSIDSVWWIAVENRGKKQVRDLVLELPFDGLYVVEQIGATTVFTEFQKTIPLGSLRPSNELKVTLWANHPSVAIWATPPNLPSWCKGEIYNETQITHLDGRVDIKYTERVTGFLAWYVRTNRNLLGFPVITIIALVIVLVLMLLIRVFVGHSDFQTDEREGPESKGEIVFIDKFDTDNKGWNLNHWKSNNPQKTNRIENPYMIFEATESDWPIRNENGANFNLRKGLEQGKKYEVVCKVRSDKNTTMQFRLWLHDAKLHGAGNSIKTDFKTPSTEFEEFKLEYTANETEAMRIHLHNKAGAGRIIVDEVVVRKI
jgi:hypothetical protein